MSLKIRYSELLGSLVFFFAFLGNQCSLLFGISDGSLFKILYFSKYIICFIFVMYYLSLRGISSIKRKTGKIFIKLSIPLFLLMLITELMACFFSQIPRLYGFEYWSRSLYVLIDRFCVWATCFLTWVFLGKRSIDCIAKAVVVDSILVLACAPIRVGCSGVITSIACIFNGGQDNFFEVHELTFAIGMLIVYYFFFDLGLDVRKKRFLLVYLMLSFILGDKRIGFLAIFIAGVFALLVNKKGLSKRALTLVGVVGVIFCLVYIAIIYNNTFFNILMQRGINSSGRDIIYGYFTRRTSFDISQSGWGIAGIGKVIENWDASEVMYMQSISGLHNDILSAYITYGFLGSIFWFAYYLLYLPNKFFVKFSKRVATIFMSLVLYLFVTYLTDNTANYFICQIIVLLIPLAEVPIMDVRKDSKIYDKKHC